VGDYLTLASTYADRRNVAKALEAFAKVPSDAQYLKARTETEARIAYARGDCEATMHILLGLRDTSFAYQYNMAVAAYTCLRYPEVVDIGQRIIARASGKDRVDLCRVVGNAAFKLKDWKKARGWYEQLANVDSRDPLVPYNLAVACYNLGEMKDSWRYYEKARELDPTIKNDDIEKRYQAGNRKPGDTAGVVMDSLDILYNQGVALQEKDSLDAAEKVYRAIVAKDSMYALAWNNLGAIAAARGDYEPAEQYYQRSILKRHDIPEAYANLVALYVAQRNWQQAKRWIIKGKGHNPESELLTQVEKMVQDSMDLEVKTVPKGGKK
jgi:tetratricopeptide (TPR) repeat protein